MVEEWKKRLLSHAVTGKAWPKMEQCDSVTVDSQDNSEKAKMEKVGKWEMSGEREREREGLRRVGVMNCKIKLKIATTCGVIFGEN